ncbi:hypothetical protein EYF80_003962 [Liparis tanakae]|uniref:Uncharacterized protein n=1 Tax=Liparis tanakae TaxID=230148 RepID=A0A4Z2J5Q5_9TELE|nr:hypothetical protein EYF80_003962 [Liparis tanakae]
MGNFEALLILLHVHLAFCHHDILDTCLPLFLFQFFFLPLLFLLHTLLDTTSLCLLPLLTLLGTPRPPRPLLVLPLRSFFASVQLSSLNKDSSPNSSPADPSCVKVELTHWFNGEMSARYKHCGV